MTRAGAIRKPSQAKGTKAKGTKGYRVMMARRRRFEGGASVRSRVRPAVKKAGIAKAKASMRLNRAMGSDAAFYKNPYWRQCALSIRPRHYDGADGLRALLWKLDWVQEEAEKEGWEGPEDLTYEFLQRNARDRDGRPQPAVYLIRRLSQINRTEHTDIAPMWIIKFLELLRVRFDPGSGKWFHLLGVPGLEEEVTDPELFGKVLSVETRRAVDMSGRNGPQLSIGRRKHQGVEFKLHNESTVVLQEVGANMAQQQMDVFGLITQSKSFAMADGEPLDLDLDELFKTAQTLDPRITMEEFRAKWARMTNRTKWVRPSTRR